MRPRPHALDHTPRPMAGKAAHGRLAVEAMVVGTADRREACQRPPTAASTNGRGRPPTAGGRSRLCVPPPIALEAVSGSPTPVSRVGLCVAPPIAAKAVSALPRAVSRAGLCRTAERDEGCQRLAHAPGSQSGVAAAGSARWRPRSARGISSCPRSRHPLARPYGRAPRRPHARAPRRLWSSRREGRQRLPPPADHVPVAAARRSSARPGPRAPGPRPRARLPPASSARLRPAPAPAFAFLRRGFAGKPAHGRLAPRPRLHARQPQTPASDPPQARQQWPCRGESGSEARSRTREPSKASQCAAAHIQEGNCMNVSRSPAEPVEAWHGFSCQRRKAERRGEICNVFRKPSAVACVCTVLAKPRSCWPCKQRRRAQAIVFMYYRQYS